MGEFPVAALDELRDRKLAAFDVAANRIAIARAGDSFYALPTRAHIKGARSPLASSKERPSRVLAMEASST
jgi:hypothetical protein